MIAPFALIGGWSLAADLQPGNFDAIQRSISTLAAYGATDRWVMTLFLLVVASANAITGLSLRPAAKYGRLLLVAGGVFGIFVALSPQPFDGSSVRHEIAAGLSCAAMTAWPLAGMRRERGAPFGLRPAPSIWATGVVSAILAWFCLEVVSGGDMIGLAERTLTGAQTVWPLFVVITVLAAGRRRSLPPLPVLARRPADQIAGAGGSGGPSRSGGSGGPGRSQPGQQPGGPAGGPTSGSARSRPGP